MSRRQGQQGIRSGIRSYTSRGSDTGTGSGKDRGAEQGAGPRPAEPEHEPLNVSEGVLVPAGVRVGMGNDRGKDRWCGDRRGIRNARDNRGVHILGNTNRLSYL